MPIFKIDSEKYEKNWVLTKNININGCRAKGILIGNFDTEFKHEELI